MERYMIYKDEKLVACDLDKKEAIKKAKARMPGVAMIGVVMDLETGCERSGFFVGPAPIALGC